MPRHLDLADLEAGLAAVRESPRDAGTLRLIVCRPAVDERSVLDEAELDPRVGLVGDSWRARGSTSTEDGTAHPDRQLTVMNDRAALLVADDPERRQLAGDQLYVDLDLSPTNVPAGTRLAIGDAIIEVTEPAHLGCAKFSARFGEQAWRFVNSRVGRELRLRGLNARVLSGGTIRSGDSVHKLSATHGAR